MISLIQHTKKIQPKTDLVIVQGNKGKELSASGLDKKVQEYVRKKIENDADVVVVNEYDRLIFITRPIKNNNSAEVEKFRIIGSKVAGYLKANHVKKVQIDGTADSRMGLAIAEGVALASYEFTRYLTDKKKINKGVETIAVAGDIPAKDIEVLNNTISGTCIARTLVNEPVSYLTAVQLSKEIEKLSKEAGFKFEYFNKKKIESLKMGGLLGVNKGSAEPPTFNILEWKPAKAVNKHPLVLVGKGVVYDTGGSSLKTSAGMEKMKGDMAGAAAVIGTIYAISRSKLPYHVIGLIPATENRLDSESIVPGDVLHMYSGKTVEVLNTDAEGRLILADALHYASKYKPELVIDLATLTGAAVATIGTEGIVAMEKNAESEFAELEKAGNNVYERMVKLPLWEEYEDYLKSSVADIKNIGGPLAGSITAGKFLEVFTSYPWIHLDLSNALLDKTSHYRTVGGSGTGTRLLVEFVKNRLK